MLTTALASLVMTEMQNVLIEKLEQKGYTYPSVVIMDSTRDINADYLLRNFKCVVSVWYSNIQGVNVVSITTRNQDERDDEEIQRLIKEVTHKYQPEGLGYFAQCLYKPMTKKELDALTTDSMNKDPEAIRVLHNCFYTKRDKENGYILITPYVLKDNVIPDTKDQEDVFSFGEDDDESADSCKKVKLIPFHTGWEVTSYVNKARIENPYLSLYL